MILCRGFVVLLLFSKSLSSVGWWAAGQSWWSTAGEHGQAVSAGTSTQRQARLFPRQTDGASRPRQADAGPLGLALPSSLKACIQTAWGQSVGLGSGSHSGGGGDTSTQSSLHSAVLTVTPTLPRPDLDTEHAQ